MSDITLQQAVEALKASITKQWGDIPTEIANEIAVLEGLASSNPPPQAENPPETPAA